MSSVISRRIRATPERTAAQAWAIITDLICRADQKAQASFENVEGIAASLIADESPLSAPIVCICEGPRLRIYCLYGEAAIDSDNASESALSWNPTNGSWKVYLPCLKENLSWVESALKKKNEPFEAYDSEEGLKSENNHSKVPSTIAVDFGGLKDL